MSITGARREVGSFTCGNETPRFADASRAIYSWVTGKKVLIVQHKKMYKCLMIFETQVTTKLLI